MLPQALEVGAHGQRVYRSVGWSDPRTRFTISRDSAASLHSHQAVADFAVIAELPNDYLMIEFPGVRRDRPVLGL